MEVAMRHTRQPIPAVYKQRVNERVQMQKATLREVAVRAVDDTELRGWYVAPEKPNGSTVILLHGVSDTRVGVSGFGELFLSNGYTILLPDTRNHGESGGSLATYGVREARDVRSWVDWLIQAQRLNGCVFGFGESMGAAIVLQSLRYEDRFCAVIAESPFADFREAAYDRASEKLGNGASLGENPLGRMLIRPTLEAGLLYARLRYGIDLSAASPRGAVAESLVPVLLIHGQQDVNLYPRNSEAIYAARVNGVEVWRVANAAHGGAWSVEPEMFKNKVLGWFAMHTPMSNRLSETTKP